MLNQHAVVAVSDWSLDMDAICWDVTFVQNFYIVVLSPVPPPQ